MIDLFRLKTPSAIDWRPNSEFTNRHEATIAGQMVAWIEPRPAYDDRGHWKMQCNLPDIDGSDGFPRYYMSFEVAVGETEAFLKWRLWKQTACAELTTRP